MTVPQILPCRGVRRKGIQLNEAATVPRAHHQCTIVNEADVPFAVSTRLCLPWSTQSNLGSHSPVPQPQGASERYRAETTSPAPRRLKTGPPTATALAKWETLSQITTSPRSQYRKWREQGSTPSGVRERASRLLDVGSTCACSSHSVNPESGCRALAPTVKRSASPTDRSPGRSYPTASAFLSVLCRHSPRRMAERDFYNFRENPRVSFLST